MLHYVHQMDANCVCIPFGVEQVVYYGFLEPFHWKQLAAVAGNDAMRVLTVNQNSKVVVQTAKP